MSGLIPRGPDDDDTEPQARHVRADDDRADAGDDDRRSPVRVEDHRRGQDRTGAGLWLGGEDRRTGRR